ncbi:hypothetical protein C2S53_011994 [Perilla frutescens var. hirtella]|uniref:Uncharacterized protein n=1 Tax=Perilla frutescens var. hirtella TaxID=608512 RepID=A0AAD4IRP9_PERFH|nr:hypothetical protein C2S53_011994 [Perilla frutescens var. hirtella]
MIKSNRPSSILFHKHILSLSLSLSLTHTHTHTHPFNSKNSLPQRLLITSKHGVVFKSEKGYELERRNPRLHLGAAAAIDGLLGAAASADVFRDAFGLQREGGAAEVGVPVQPTAAAGGGHRGGEPHHAPPPLAALQLRRPAAALPCSGGGGGELRLRLAARAAPASRLGSLPVLVSLFLV